MTHVVANFGALQGNGENSNPRTQMIVGSIPTPLTTIMPLVIDAII
jgi:hypothetical protein